MAAHEENEWPSVGTSGGRQWGDSHGHRHSGQLIRPRKPVWAFPPRGFESASRFRQARSGGSFTKPPRLAAYFGNTGRVPRYACVACVRAHHLHGTDHACQSVGGIRLERAITAAFLDAITRPGIRASAQAIEEIGQQHDERLAGQRLAVDRRVRSWPRPPAVRRVRARAPPSSPHSRSPTRARAGRTRAGAPQARRARASPEPHVRVRAPAQPQSTGWKRSNPLRTRWKPPGTIHYARHRRNALAQSLTKKLDRLALSRCCPAGPGASPDLVIGRGGVCDRRGAVG